jgi:hypothetical protein
MVYSGAEEPQNVQSIQNDTFCGSYAPGKASVPPAMIKKCIFLFLLFLPSSMYGTNAISHQAKREMCV